MKSTTKAYLAITLQSIIIGFSFLFVKIALYSADALSLLAHRFTVAAAGMLIFKLIKPDMIRLTPKDWLKIIPFSLPYPVLFFLFQTLGLNHITSSEAGIVHAITPILTMIAARILLKEKATTVQKLLMALSVAGVVYINIMSGLNPNGNTLGYLFILISAASFSAYNVLIKRISKTYNVYTIVFVMSITACIVFNTASLINHGISGTMSAYFEAFTSPTFVGAVLYMGILASLVTASLSTYALTKLQASRVGLFNNVSTVVTVLGGTLFLHDKLYSYHYIGIVAVLAGAIGFNLIQPTQKDA